MTSDIVYVPINYIRNHHYNFLNQRFTKLYMTPDIVYIPINYIRNHHYDFLNRCLKNLIRLLMFHGLVITISSELKSGFQFNHGINNK